MIRTLPALFALLFAAPLLAAPAGQQTLFNFVRPADVVKVATQDASLPQYNAEQTPDGEVLRRITFNPASAVNLISDSFGQLELEGAARIDPVRAADSKYGGYARLKLIDTPVTP